MASLKDVAKLAGVSLMTVSRALNSPEKLSPKTYQVVKHAIETLNYVPNFAAQNIRGTAGKTIGVLSLGTATTPFSVEIILAIEKTVRKYGWHSFTINTFEGDEKELEQAIEQLISHRPSAIIIARNGLKKIRIPQKLQRFPIVLANCVSDDLAVASYIPNDFQGQFEIAQRIVKKGYKRPLYLHIPENYIATEQRKLAFEKAWFAQPNPAEPVHFFMAANSENYFDGALPLFELMPENPKDFPFDVIICGNDRIALIAYQYLLSLGLRIPEDVAITGFDNMVGIAELFLPPLTTVQLPHYEIGEQATLHLIEGQTNTLTHYVDCPVKVRESC